MGTNFYMFTKNKNYKERLGPHCRIVDEPDFGYEIHIAKTSGGWLPLFERNGEIDSVKALKKLAATGDFIIYDEYNENYTWEEFKKRVVDFNGGVSGKVQGKIVNINPFNGPTQYEEVPISHLEYENGKYRDSYYQDGEGYEFTEQEFC